MHRRLATSAAFGATFALAVSLIASAGPAFAATQRPNVISSDPIVVQPLGTSGQSTTVTFKPDIRVNFIGKSNAGGGKVAYRFRVQNIGAASASNVGLGTKIYQLSNDGAVATLQSGSAGSIASLGQDQAKEITVTCTPLAGYHCDGASLEAYLTDDLNPNNNKATGQ